MVAFPTLAVLLAALVASCVSVDARRLGNKKGDQILPTGMTKPNECINAPHSLRGMNFKCDDKDKSFMLQCDTEMNQWHKIPCAHNTKCKASLWTKDFQMPCAFPKHPGSHVRK
ncbi:hypothetical protein HK101_002552 [Irineochytrium annulatum]|nr:hypothetical protein HK101_002552 [Irineochytrium annulatum]